MLTLRLVKLLLVIYFTVCFGLKIPIPSQINSVQMDKIRIIGGKSVNVEDYNYQVSVRYNGIHVCGGSIINKGIIVSAAHCFEYPIEDITLIEIQAGSTYINQDQKYDTDMMVIKVNKLIIHPEYNIPAFLDNDIAILKLKNYLIFTNKIQPISLPKINSIVTPGQYVEISGWGTIDTNSNKLSAALKSVVIPIVDFRICNILNFYQVNSYNMICAGDLRGGKDSCAGDSGGPLVWRNYDNIYLIGIISWGFGCGYPLHPGVYTKVSVFVNWITMNSNID